MKSKNYEFFEKYFKDLSYDIKPKNNIASTLKMFIIPLFSITVSIVIAIFIYKKNSDLSIFFPILIVLIIGFAAAYYLLGNVKLINKLFSVDYEDHSETITDYDFNHIINVLFDADKILSNNLGETKDKLNEKDIVCINEALHYLYISSLKYSATYQEYEEEDASPIIDKERYKAVFNYLKKLHEQYSTRLTKIQKDTSIDSLFSEKYIERINTLIEEVSI